MRHAPLSTLVGSIALVTSLAACQTREGQARVMAARDFECKQDKIELEDLDDGSYRATGCEKRATYVCGHATGASVECANKDGRIEDLSKPHTEEKDVWAQEADKKAAAEAKEAEDAQKADEAQKAEDAKKEKDAKDSKKSAPKK